MISKNDLRSYSAAIKPKLTTVNKANISLFAKDCNTCDKNLWNSIILSDESKFESSNLRKIFVRRPFAQRFERKYISFKSHRSAA